MTNSSGSELPIPTPTANLAKVRRDFTKNGTFWVHGAPARSLEQVTAYLNGDAHSQSKVQVIVEGQFYDLLIPDRSGT